MPSALDILLPRGIIGRLIEALKLALLLFGDCVSAHVVIVCLLAGSLNFLNLVITD